MMKKLISLLLAIILVLCAAMPVAFAYSVSDLKRTLEYNMKGDDVKMVQERLQFYGYYSYDTTDPNQPTGHYTNSVKQAVLKFQKANGLKQDGKVGPNTWGILVTDTGVKSSEDVTYTKLTYGMTDDLVVTAKYRLAFYGFWDVQPDTMGKYFSANLKAAVRRFQKRNGLTDDGVIGAKTWAVLNGTTGVHFTDPTFERIERGDNDDRVKTVQLALKNYYYYTGKIDGDFDSEVEKAVVRFQESNGMTADGIVGEKTYDALVNGTADILNGAIPKVALYEGVRGYDVYVLQNRLYSLNFLTGIYHEGLYDTKTVEAVKAFQAKNGLPENGIFNNETVRYLWASDVSANEDIKKDTIEDFPKLSLYSTGKDVSNAQMKLKTAGFLLGKADGKFGPITEEAVRKFQKANGLYPDGIIGEQTWLLLNAIDVTYADQEITIPDQTSSTVPTRKLFIGTSGSSVSWLQKKLADLGYLTYSDIDGKFGPITDGAVRSFQKDQGLTDDGIVGNKTYNALYNAAP